MRRNATNSQSARRITLDRHARLSGRHGDGRVRSARSLRDGEPRRRPAALSAGDRPHDQGAGRHVARHRDQAHCLHSTTSRDRSTRCWFPAAPARPRLAPTSGCWRGCVSNRLRARRFGSICTGALLLAAAPARRQARDDHSTLASELGRRYPEVSVEADAIYVRDGNVYTSAGVTTGIDLALSLIEEDHGRTLSLRVARALVAYLKRPGGQSQFSNHLLAQFAASPPAAARPGVGAREPVGQSQRPGAGQACRHERAQLSPRLRRGNRRRRRADFVERIAHRRRAQPVRGGTVLESSSWPRAAALNRPTTCASPSAVAFA